MKGLVSGLVEDDGIDAGPPVRDTILDEKSILFVYTNLMRSFRLNPESY